MKIPGPFLFSRGARPRAPFAPRNGETASEPRRRTLAVSRAQLNRARTAAHPTLNCQRKKCVVARAAASLLYEPSLETFLAARRARTAKVPRREAPATTHRTTPVPITRIRSFAPAFCRRRASFLIASPRRSRGPIRAAASRENRGFAKLATVPRSSLDVAVRTGPQAVASLSSTSHEA